MRILIVEDEPLLLEQLNSSLTKQGYAVDCAADGEEGLFQGTEYPYDLAIIDLGLPKIDGLDVIKKLREQGKNYPILILTARDQWQEKVIGLDSGADDYLTKPFEMDELLARVKALLRRSVGMASASQHFGPLSLDLNAQSVAVDGTEIELTAYEYKVIEYLLTHPHQVISKTVLTEHIYDQDYDRDSNVIEVFVRRLRKKLDPNGTIEPIETLRGRGYRINPAIANG
ncbi:response regulator transcription factor [Psychrobium sp. 1_MG-2023]|uniref:response regulator transcription factor n=1 Tax=Psychrobium sp. 1_MG-2023 TaxID=3062624 RepID=UPI000C327D66|nr:response regulator transcription factor [Psychrobium sp. 1_MG-2023]MDP2562286.1 response regulator transcription factor [Psychrobium sp. 1_MG-2023]PKF54669.1 DNA-binding response regulator [Alteromonadales bacterium alter-6D02]